MILGYGALGSPAAIIAAITSSGAFALFLLKGVPMAMGIQRGTIKTLERKISEQARRIDAQDATIAALQQVIDTTRDLTPIREDLRTHETAADARSKLLIATIEGLPARLSAALVARAAS